MKKMKALKKLGIKIVKKGCIYKTMAKNGDGKYISKHHNALYLTGIKKAGDTTTRYFSGANALEKATEYLLNDYLNKKYIVRGDRSGLLYGTVVWIAGNTVLMKNARRLWYWDGANAVNELAVHGTSKPNECKFTVYVDSIVIMDAIEINRCTEKAIKSIEGVGEWKKAKD